MSLYRKPGSPYWYADITVAGTRYRFSTKRRNKKEALAVEQATIRDKLDRVQLGVAQEMTIGDAFQRVIASSLDKSYIPTLVSRSWRLTGVRYWTKAEGLLSPPRREPHDGWMFDPEADMTTITSQLLRQYVEARKSEGYAHGYINAEIAQLRKVYYRAHKVWGVAVTPDVVFPRYRVPGKERYLSVSEEQRLLDELHPDNRKGVSDQKSLQNQYDLVVFLLDTGARYGEASSITWDAVDTQTWRYVNIYRWKVGNDGFLGLTQRLREVLQRRYRERRNSPYIFPHRDDPTRPRSYATRGIALAMDRAGINAPHLVQRYGRATVHSLRDTFASRLVEMGYSIAKLQKLLGHANIQQTMKYAKFQEKPAATEAAELLDRIHAA